MGKEIERKFIVTGKGWRKCADRGKTIRQAYLALTDKISLRVRIIGLRKACITVKSARSGISRAEFECSIPVKDAKELMKYRVGHIIKKRRHAAKVGKTRFEIDVFQGHQDGLIIAEVELPTVRTRIERPEWLGKEVTHDRRYSNANLAQ